MNMEQKRIWETALKQSATDMNAEPSDFLKEGVTFRTFRPAEGRRVYLPDPIRLDMVSYGKGIVAVGDEAFEDIVKDYVGKYGSIHIFETPNLYSLNGMLDPFDLRACFMAEFFLPDIKKLDAFSCDLDIRILHQEDFRDLYLPEWGNALSFKRKELDMIGTGYYEKGRLVGFAGASADCDGMWQIGIDVLPGYRGRGLASALTNALAKEILSAGKIPFYCCAWSNLASLKNAIRSGFTPAWVELTAREKDFVEKCNE